MNKWIFKVLVLVACFIIYVGGREPFKPSKNSVPFLVYFPSRYRGICVGLLVSRVAVLTAAVCVTNPTLEKPDTRPINVVVGTMYRHPRRGIRVQVTKVLMPKIEVGLPHRAYLLEKSVAVLLLKRKIPDVLVENPLRSLEVHWMREPPLTLSINEECLMTGWHFFYKGDKIYKVYKFLLQRNVRAQFLDIVRMNEWCDALTLKYQKSLDHIGFKGYFDLDSQLCVRDRSKSAQPCHGMYGAPLICEGRAVGMMLAPDAQWANCTGLSNIVHLLNSEYLEDFMKCVSSLFVSDPDYQMNWATMKKSLIEENPDSYDYIPAMYDKVLRGSSSSSEEF